jgi:hypothetical protein
MSLPGGRAFGMTPAVSNYQSFAQILKPPGAYALFTFTATGRIWAASVSYAMGSSGGTGANQGYARVHVVSGNPLAIVECCVVGNPSADSNTSDMTYFGLVVPKGTIINLDVNGNTAITGVVQRGSGLVGVSIP